MQNGDWQMAGSRIEVITFSILIFSPKERQITEIPVLD